MKKFISTALALVMTLSLCVFVAPEKASAGFADESELSSKYAVQAADVIQKIEVMDGYDDGTFRPTAGLTRQAAAKIICNMILGPTTARALPTNANPFPDVLAGNQFSGYISYCSQQGIISGYGDGTFRPGDPLSGYAYLKMLLGALGYDARQEGFVGDNWKVNVAKIALGIGLNKGMDEELDAGTQVTREAAAIFAFNTLQADMVEYESKNTLEINGVTVSMGGGNAVPQTWNTSSTSANNINRATSDGANARPIVQFAERYFDKLRREPNVWDTYTTDNFGRPSIRWFWKGVEIGTYSRDPDATFVGGTDVNKIYEALGMTSGCDTSNLYINSSIPNNERLDVSRGNDKGLDNAANLLMNATSGRSLNVYGDGNHRVNRIGDGTLIECFLNDANNHVDVCVISVYAGKVDAVKGATTKKDAYVTINVGDIADHAPDTITNGDNNQFETEDFEEDDVVAYTYSDSDQSIQSMYLMTAEGGTLQSRVQGKSLTLDGTKYSYGKEYTFDDIAGNENGLSNKSSYIVYLDDNDFVLWIEEDEFAVDQYVLIERISLETTSNTGVKTTTASVLGGSVEVDNTLTGVNDAGHQYAFQQSKAPLGNSTWDARARLRYSNGSVRTVTLDDSKNYRTDTAGDAAANATYTAGTPANTSTANRNNLTNGTGDGNGNWIAEPFTAGHIVRVSSNNGSYKLHTVNNTHYAYAPNFTIENKLIKSAGAAIAKAGGGTIVADSETHFVVDDLDQNTYKSYVGIKNVPDVQKGLYSTGTVAYIYHNDGVAKLIFVTSAQNVMSSSSDVIFLNAGSTSNLVDSDDGRYYDVNAVNKGEITTLRVKSGVTVYMGRNDGTAPVAFKPGSNDDELHCVILNNVTYDSNDFITAGTFTGNNQAVRVQGVRRVNSEEVRLDTHSSSSYLRDVAENIKVYFVDGDDIEQIDYSDVVNDSMDMVYYVEDDGEITYLFIVDYSEDAPEETNTRFYGDGELQIVNNQSFVYHYLNSFNVTDLRDAVRGYVNDATSTVAVNNNGDGTYDVNVGGITYKVQVANDGRKVLTGPSRGPMAASDVTGFASSASIASELPVGYVVSGTTTAAKFTASDYIQGMPVVVTFTASNANPAPTVTVTPTSNGVAGTPLTYSSSPVLVSGTTSQYTITFPVPASADSFTVALNVA